MNNNKKHCCQIMEMSVDGSSDISPWRYNERHRAYYVKSVNHPGSARVNYCAFCGTKLPQDLTSEWIRILEEEYGFESAYEAKRNGLIPPEFQTDEWWKKRGL
jgi:hypothetical protein